MKNAVQIEHRASSSRSKHEGESSFGLCDRLSRTRDNSQRQLPTDQDYAVSTREYQTDQSSLKTAPTAARSVLDERPKQRQQQTHRLRRLTRSLHIRAMRSLSQNEERFLSCGWIVGNSEVIFRPIPIPIAELHEKRGLRKLEPNLPKSRLYGRLPLSTVRAWLAPANAISVNRQNPAGSSAPCRAKTRDSPWPHLPVWKTVAGIGIPSGRKASQQGSLHLAP